MPAVVRNAYRQETVLGGGEPPPTMPETPWERTAENLGSVITDLSKRPLSERLRLLPSFQIMYNGAPDRVIPDLERIQQEAQEAERLRRMGRRARRARQAGKK